MSKPITYTIPASQPTSQPSQPNQPASPANPTSQPTNPAQPNHHPPSQPVYKVRGSVSYLTKVPIIGGCRRERGSSQKYRVLPLSFYVNKRHTNSMKSANFTYKMQFRCGGGRGHDSRLECTMIKYVYFGAVEIIEFYGRKNTKKHIKNTPRIQNN